MTDSAKQADVVAHSEGDRIVAKYGPDDLDIVEGDEETMVHLAEELLAAADRGEKTEVEVWEENKEGIYVNVPDGAPELWSSDEWTQFHDQFIGRRTEWFCQHCSDAPKRTLEKTRRHVEKQHSQKLLEKHVDMEDLDAY